VFNVGHQEVIRGSCSGKEFGPGMAVTECLWYEISGNNKYSKRQIIDLMLISEKYFTEPNSL
jgi:hypothetical protein